MRCSSDFIAAHADNLAIEAQLIAEVVKEQRLVIARRLGDGVYPRAVEAITREDFFRRVEDGLARHRRLAFAFIGPRHTSLARGKRFAALILYAPSRSHGGLLVLLTIWLN